MKRIYWVSIAVAGLAGVAMVIYGRPAPEPGVARETRQGAAPDPGARRGAIILPGAPADATSAAGGGADDAARKMIDGIEHVRTLTQAGAVVWVPVAPEPPEALEDAAPPEEYPPGPEAE